MDANHYWQGSLLGKTLNRFIKAPYVVNAKYKPFGKGGADVTNVFNQILKFCGPPLFPHGL